MHHDARPPHKFPQPKGWGSIEGPLQTEEQKQRRSFPSRKAGAPLKDDDSQVNHAVFIPRFPLRTADGADNIAVFPQPKGWGSIEG